MTHCILIIGLVWPEPTSSAAGWRMLQLIKQLQNISTNIHFACAASKSDSSFNLSTLNVTEHSIELNDPSFDLFVSNLAPTIVMYDRFLTEEQFGWRVKMQCPDCLTILDTEDLHFVRRARAHAYKTNSVIDYNTTDCFRELSSIYRCDVSIIISQTEYDLLVQQFNIPNSQLHYLPFVENEISKQEFNDLPNFQDRENIMFIGNFIHEPNYMTVLKLKSIWPTIRKMLPKVEIHIYGAYPNHKVQQLHNEKDGFIIKGKAADVNETMKNYKILLAPIPFGAGLKGKFIDGFKNKLPNITTAIGAEGMAEDQWGGFICNDDNDIAIKAVELYTNEIIWNNCVCNGFTIINKYYNNSSWKDSLNVLVNKLYKELEQHRKSLIIQQLLWQNQLQATKYMSLWINEKNKSK